MNTERPTDDDVIRELERYEARTGDRTFALGREVVRARASEDAKDAEIARIKAELAANAETYIADHNATVAGVAAVRAENERLQREVDHRLDEMNLQARWTREAEEKVKRLRAALKPFAAVARVKIGWAEAFALPEDRVVHHEIDYADATKDAKVTLADCRAALNALEET